MRAIRVNKIEDFEHSLKEALENENEKVYVLFFGTEIPETDESWCSDCVIADPKIRRYANQVSNCLLLECPVGDRNSYKGNSEHPYKTNKDIKLTAIPTLIHWTKTGPGARLVEEECAKDDLLQSFFEL